MVFAKLNSMKFVGLDGLSHFWSKAKTWIINRITTEVTAKIAEIVANAPEDLDTLKEIADWISTHEDSASAMNTAISTNTSDIATLKTTVAGKSDTGHTHTKTEITDFPTSLPANGGTADYAKRLKTFASWDSPYVYDETNGIRYFVFKIQMVDWFNSILIQIYSDINYALSRKYILGLWHTGDRWGYNVSVTDLGGTINNGLRVWLGKDGNVYLQAKCEWSSRISFSHLEDIMNITIKKIGLSKEGSNKDIDGNVLFTPLTDPIIDCGAIRGVSDLSSASKVPQCLKADEFIGTATNATNATNDSNGNNIANTYMPKSGGTFMGSVTFESPTYFNDEIHGNYLFPKDSIDSMFSFYKDTDNNYLPIIYGYNCGDVFNNDMCLRYYYCNYTSMSVALNNLNQLKKLFASMYPYETDGCARCTSIHVTINVSFTDGKPAIIGDIINYGYCNSDDIARVNKDGSVYVGEDFYSNYHVLYISYDDGFKEKDVYYLANEILKNGMRHINHFSFIGNYVLAEHL